MKNKPKRITTIITVLTMLIFNANAQKLGIGIMGSYNNCGMEYSNFGPWFFINPSNGMSIGGVLNYTFYKRLYLGTALSYSQNNYLFKETYFNSNNTRENYVEYHKFNVNSIDIPLTLNITAGKQKSRIKFTFGGGLLTNINFKAGHSAIIIYHSKKTYSDSFSYSAFDSSNTNNPFSLGVLIKGGLIIKIKENINIAIEPYLCLGLTNITGINYALNPQNGSFNQEGLKFSVIKYW